MGYRRCCNIEIKVVRVLALGSTLDDSLLNLFNDAVSTTYSSRGLMGEDKGSKVFRIVGILPQNYTASQPRRPRLEFPHCENLNFRVSSTYEHIIWRRNWGMNAK
jgi:hypothetical protein